MTVTRTDLIYLLWEVLDYSRCGFDSAVQASDTISHCHWTSDMRGFGQILDKAVDA